MVLNTYTCFCYYLFNCRQNGSPPDGWEYCNTNIPTLSSDSEALWPTSPHWSWVTEPFATSSAGTGPAGQRSSSRQPWGGQGGGAGAGEWAARRREACEPAPGAGEPGVAERLAVRQPFLLRQPGLRGGVTHVVPPSEGGGAWVHSISPVSAGQWTRHMITIPQGLTKQRSRRYLKRTEQIDNLNPLMKLFQKDGLKVELLTKLGGFQSWETKIVSDEVK